MKYKVRKMAKSLLKHHCNCPSMTIVIDADHQNCCLFINKGNFFITFICVLLGVLAIFHEYYFTNSSNLTLGIDFNH